MRVEDEDLEFGDAFGDEPEDGKKVKNGEKETDVTPDGSEGNADEGQEPGGTPNDGQGQDAGDVQGQVVQPDEADKTQPDDGSSDKHGKKDESSEPDWKTKAQEAEAKRLEAEKRAKDNQAAYTKNQQELAALKKQMEELSAKLETVGKQPDPEPQMPDEVREWIEDNPGSQKAIEHLSELLAEKKLKALQESLGDLDRLNQIPSLQEQMNQERWERAVVFGFIDPEGNYVQGVQDYYRIAAPSNKKYWDWYEKKGYGPCDPADAISRLNEWRAIEEEHRIAADTAEQDRIAAEKAAKAQEVLKAGIQSSRKPVAPAKPDPNDFDGGFNDE